MSRPDSLARPRPAITLFCSVGMLALGCGQGLFGGVVVDASVPADAGSDLLSDAVSDLLSDAGSDLLSDAGSDLPSDAGSELLSDAGSDLRSDAGSDSGLNADTGVPADAGSDAAVGADQNPGSDAASDPVPDTGGSEAGNDETSKTVDKNGDDLYLAEAHLIIGPGTFASPTRVTIRRIPSISYAGAWGPVFEISVPSRGLFRQVAKLVLQVQDIGANQPNLALGTLDPSLALADLQWIPVADSSLNAEQTQVSGSVTGFGNASVLQYAAVVQCTQTPTCPSGQACNAGACQQCPTSSPCAP
jgi:hypothetical protein